MDILDPSSLPRWLQVCVLFFFWWLFILSLVTTVPVRCRFLFLFCGRNLELTCIARRATETGASAWLFPHLLLFQGQFTWFWVSAPGCLCPFQEPRVTLAVQEKTYCLLFIFDVVNRSHSRYHFRACVCVCEMLYMSYSVLCVSQVDSDQKNRGPIKKCHHISHNILDGRCRRKSQP